MQLGAAVGEKLWLQELYDYSLVSSKVFAFHLDSTDEQSYIDLGMLREGESVRSGTDLIWLSSTSITHWQNSISGITLGLS